MPSMPQSRYRLVYACLFKHGGNTNQNLSIPEIGNVERFAITFYILD